MHNKKKPFIFFVAIITILVSGSIILLHARGSQSKSYYASSTPLNGWLHINLTGPERIVPGRPNMFRLELLPVNYQVRAHRYKWSPASWQLGDPGIQLAVLSPPSLHVPMQRAHFSGRTAIHGESEPGPWHTMTGPTPSSPWTKYGIGKLLNMAINGTLKTVGLALTLASAAEAIADDDAKRQLLARFSESDYEQVAITLPGPESNICAARIDFSLIPNEINSKPIGLLIRADKRTPLGQWDTQYFMVVIKLGGQKPDRGGADLLINGDFSANNTHGWTNESSGPGLGHGQVGFVNDQGQQSVLRLNSLAGANYYMDYSQYIPVSSPADINMTLSFKWKQNRIDCTYGVATVEVLFFNSFEKGARGKLEAEYSMGTIRFQHQCSSFYDQSCINKGNRYCSENLKAKSFGWSTESVNFLDALAHMPDVDQRKIRQVKIRITSYNNAGSGTDALWDDIRVQKH